MKTESAPTLSAEDRTARPAAPHLAAALARWALGLAASTFFAPTVLVSGLLFVLLGVSALSLTAFTTAEFRGALGGSALFWEIAARNAWMTGATGTVLFFVRALSDSDAEGIETARGMAFAFVPAVYGLMLAALFLVRALRLRDAARATSTPLAASISERSSLEPASGHPWGHGLGYLLYVVLVAWTIAHPYFAKATPRFMPWDWVLYWPAVLVVTGGTLTIALIAGKTLWGRIAVAGFALAGTLGSLAGLIQALLGFADRDISRIMSGLGLMVTACFVALLGMTLVANPAEDRRAKRGEPGVPSAWSRAAWLLFPLATVFFLVLTFILVATPMTKKIQ